jgi:hypothetical protein
MMRGSPSGIQVGKGIVACILRKNRDIRAPLRAALTLTSIRESVNECHVPHWGDIVTLVRRCDIISGGRQQSLLQQTPLCVSVPIQSREDRVSLQFHKKVEEDG